MRINPELKLRTIVGESVVMLTSGRSCDMSRLMSLNSTSKFLWEKLFGKDFTVDDVTGLLMGEYDVERPRAEEDARKWVEQLMDFGVIE